MTYKKLFDAEDWMIDVLIWVDKNFIKDKKEDQDGLDTEYFSNYD